MGGVCKVWQIIHRDVMIRDYNDSNFIEKSFIL